MATKKISELSEAESVGENDVLAGVQDGETKKFPAKLFVKVGESVSDASSVGGYTADQLLKKTDTATDSAKLGGVSASEYVKQSDLADTAVGSPFWWMPIPFYCGYGTDGHLLVNPEDYEYYICDGRTLPKTSYPDLYEVLGDRFILSTDSSDTFRIPDLRGRTLFGCNIAKPTINEYIPVAVKVGEYIGDGTVSEAEGDAITQKFISTYYSGDDDIRARQAVLSSAHNMQPREIAGHWHGYIEQEPYGDDENNGDWLSTSYMIVPNEKLYEYNASTQYSGKKQIRQRFRTAGTYASFNSDYDQTTDYTYSGLAGPQNASGDGLAGWYQFPFNIIPPAISVNWVMRFNKPQ